MNIWINTNKHSIDLIKRTLIEASYQPMYQEFPIRQFQYILNGLETEINRLENEKTQLKGRIRELENQMKDETPNPVPDQQELDDDINTPV